MKPSLRTLALGLALTTALASLATAGGAGVSLERAKDGQYFVHSYACTGPSSVKDFGCDCMLGRTASLNSTFLVPRA